MIYVCQNHACMQTEVFFLGQLRHPHLVKLIGYCYEDEHRLLVYEFMTRGSLEKHLFKSTANSINLNSSLSYINNKNSTNLNNFCVHLKGQITIALP